MLAMLPTLKRYARPWRLWAMLGVTLAGAALEGVGFLMLVPLVDTALGGAAGGAAGFFEQWVGPMPGLEVLLAIFIALLALRALSELANRLIAFDIRMAVIDGLRGRAVRALVGADWRYLSRLRQSDNRSLLLSAVDRAGNAASALFGTLKTATNLVAVAVAAFVISPTFALAGAAAGALVLFLYRGLRRRAGELGNALVGRNKAVFGNLETMLDSLRVVKSFGAEDMASRRASEGFRAMRQVQRRYILQAGLARLILQLGGGIVLAAIVFFAVTRWEVSGALLLPLIAIFARAVPQIGSLQEQWQDFAHSSPALGETERLIADAEAHEEVAGETGRSATSHSLGNGLALREVTVRHDGERPALDAASLEAAAGSVIALTGPSGCGKSTLADVIGGLIAPDGGDVLLDGKVLEPADRKGWRAKVAYVQQEPVLFAGTLRENFAWAAPEASDEQIHAALARANAGFVLERPGGLDAETGDAGRFFSGGERQRIVLARALLRDPELLILDEATSALDHASEAEIAKAIEGMRGSCTILVITHRGLLSDLADLHVAMEAGRIVSATPAPERG